MKLIGVAHPRIAAEFVGTFTLVLGGCGAAVLAAGAPTEVGTVGVAVAFGLAVLTMAYAVGHLSGAHFNPAVTVGLAVAGRFAWRDVPGYVASQLVGAISAAALLLAIATGRDGFTVDDGFATNGFADQSPGGYSLLAALLVEVVLTAVFVLVFLCSTADRAPAGFAPIAIGLAFTLIHLVSMPVTNASVNPARSTAPALFAGTGPLSQLWLFWVAPLAGAALAGAAYALLTDGRARDRSAS